MEISRILNKRYGQVGNKWPPTLFPVNCRNGEVGAGGVTESKFSDSCPGCCFPSSGRGTSLLTLTHTIIRSFHLLQITTTETYIYTAYKRREICDHLGQKPGD